jgi:hypothetical protein
MSASAAIGTDRKGRFRFAVGAAIGLILPLVFGEAYARLRPPADIQEFLGDESPLRGIYRPDPVLGIDYRAVDDYRPAEAPPFAEIRPLNVPRTWLFFGNSFARGMSETAKREMPACRILFFREAKDRLHQRIAEARLLLSNGLKPERMIFTLISGEIAAYVKLPLASVYVNRAGAITYRVRMPPWPWDEALNHSRLALMAWVHSGLHYAIPRFRPTQITEIVPDIVVADFRRLFGALAGLSREYAVPVTVVIFPDRHQILGADSKFAMQKAIIALAEEAGLDVFDPSPALLRYSDKKALYIQDWHYTELGNRMIFAELQRHLEQTGAAKKATALPISP